MRYVFLAAVFWLAGCFAARPGVAPVPESEQAAQALKIIDAWHGPRAASPPKKLHVVYFTPADREPAARYQERLDAILEDVRGFYRDEMVRLGFGPKTFPLVRDAQGRLVIHAVKSKEPEAAFPRWEGRNGGNTGAPAGGDMVRSECQPVLEAAGISLEKETVLIFCHLATYDEKARTFRHHSPYYGSWSQQNGLCFAADWAAQDLDNLTRKKPTLNDGEYGNMSLGRHMTIFLGGVAHELGHAFALPHCGERWDEKTLGTSLLGAGNHTYREERRGEGKGSFLTMAGAMRLAARPLFNGSDKEEAQPGRIERCDLTLSTNLMRADLAGRRAALRLAGTFAGSPPVYAVIAYFDSSHDGGYRAPTSTSVPDVEGRFAIEVSDLAPCGNGELRVEFCHVNGAVSERHLGFSVTPDRSVDLSQWELREALEPVIAAVAANQPDAAQAALEKLEASKSPALAQDTARALVGTLRPESKPAPAAVPANISRLPLGDTRPQVAEVGWLKPAANRIPPNEEMDSPLLDSGKLHATGLYAHSPSRYVFDLGGKWKTLRGEAGLHSIHQPYAAGVVFVIKADGKEVFRSRTVRGSTKPGYSVDLKGVKTLELIVEKANSQNNNNWALWLDPVLGRSPRHSWPSLNLNKTGLIIDGGRLSHLNASRLELRAMKVVAINGSPRKGGNTEILLKKALAPLAAAGWETELIQLGGVPIRGCRACYHCFDTKDARCGQKDDFFNQCFQKMVAADAILLGSPTYFTDVSAEMKALLDRAGLVALASGGLFRGKIGAAVVAVRRGGGTHAFDTMNHMFLMSGAIVPGSTYWNLGFGLEKGEVDKDDEAARNMQDLGETIAWLGEAIHRHAAKRPAVFIRE